MAKITGKSEAQSKFDQIFSEGWLDRHIDAVVTEMATWPADFRPQLIGPRAETTRNFDWSKFTESPERTTLP